MKKILAVLLITLSLAACKAQPENFVKVKGAKGDRVQIESAYLVAPGYIIIREVDSNKQLGPIIGQSILYPIGPLDNKVIATSNLRTGQKYLATLHLENGDLRFTERLDLVAKNNKGKEVRTFFTAQ